MARLYTGMMEECIRHNEKYKGCEAAKNIEVFGKAIQDSTDLFNDQIKAVKKSQSENNEDVFMDKLKTSMMIVESTPEMFAMQFCSPSWDSDKPEKPTKDGLQIREYIQGMNDIMNPRIKKYREIRNAK